MSEPEKMKIEVKIDDGLTLHRQRMMNRFIQQLKKDGFKVRSIVMGNKAKVIAE